jgi:ribosomal protein S18 acetylase RimI-like enzyme
MIGLVQPLLYVDDGRDGRPRGTIRYIGVVPTYRGRGYVGDLPFRATAALNDRGVRQVFCETATQNFPMT